MTHKQIKKEALRNLKVRAEYDTLKTEFILLRELLSARRNAGLTQAEIAERRGGHRYLRTAEQ